MFKYSYLNCINNRKNLLVKQKSEDVTCKIINIACYEIFSYSQKLDLIYI